MASNIQGKVAIVTGSSAGLGEAIALMFASRGASVTLCGRHHERLKLVLDKAVKVSGGHQERFLTVQGDVTDQRVQKQIVDQTVERFGHLDILVANVGIIRPFTTFLEETEDAYNAIMDTNLKSVFFLTQKAVPHLEKTKGNILFISSVFAEMVANNVSVISMSKAALDHLARSLAVDLGSKGIRVNSVNPGFFPTLILRDFPDLNESNKALIKTQIAIQPLRDRIGIADDVAEAVTFLVSDAAGFITGEHISVDGGSRFTGKFEWKS